MSTDYFLFVNSDRFADVDLPLLASNDGVALDDAGNLVVDGLVCTYWKAMDCQHRDIMLNDFGAYGQDYNWFVTGKYDKDTSVNELVERLVRCAASLVSSRPLAPLALMVNAESFYVLNTPASLILSPVCFDDAGVIPALFRRPFTRQHIDPWRITSRST